MKIKIPGHGPVTIFSDEDTYISVPGDGPIQIVTPEVEEGNELYFATDYFAAEYFA